jgi:hypothetical protein
VCQWSNLAERIESDALGRTSKLGSGHFKFFLGTLAHELMPARTADDQSQTPISAVPNIPGSGLACGVGCAENQSIRVSAHEPSVPTFGNMAGKRHEPRIVIDGQRRANEHATGFLRRRDLKWKHNAVGGGSCHELITEIAAIEFVGRLPIQIIKDIALGPRECAGTARRRPSRWRNRW